MRCECGFRVRTIGDAMQVCDVEPYTNNGVEYLELICPECNGTLISGISRNTDVI